MGVLRTLAALVGRMFDRLARVLLRWSRGPEPGEPEPDGWVEAPDNGPPEHWIRHIRQRAPWLLRGSRPAPLGVPVRRTASPIQQRRQPVRPVAAPEPPRPASEHPRMNPSASERPIAHPEAPEARAPHGGIHDAEPSHAAVVAAETASLPVSSPVGPVLRRGRAPVGARVTAPLAAQERESVSRSGVLEPAEARRSPVVNPPGQVLRVRGGPAILHAESTGPVAGRRSPPNRHTEDAVAPWPELPARARAENPDARLPAASTSLTAAAEGRTKSGARAEGQRSARGHTEFQEEHRWPDLPEPRSRGDEWEVPSSRLREREQLRLTRLRAEQAGSSWSELHS
jgi:hypothetical protein